MRPCIERSEAAECPPSVVVIAGLDPAIHSVTVVAGPTVTEWMPGSSPGMTTVKVAIEEEMQWRP
jgi:hypothetical protein